MAKHSIEPRMLTMREVYEYIKVSAAWFSKRREELEALGFPKRHPVTNNYDRKQVDTWLDKTGGNIAPENMGEARLLEKLRNGDH